MEKYKNEMFLRECVGMNHIGIVTKEQCTGCFACLNICPREAIEIKKDKALAEYPYVKEDKCISCGLCQSVCSALNRKEFGNNPLKCFAAYSNDDKIQKTCASGGIGTIFAETIIQNGGFVFGSALVKEGNVLRARHLEAKNIDDVKKFSGSKYVQSEIEKSYISVKEKLKAGKPVLFVGTPCQVDGLNYFLHNEEEKKLITVDIICHGTPPTSYLNDYYQSLNLGEIDEIKFFSQGAFVVKAFCSGKKVYEANASTDLYFAAFLNSVIYRENCYHCRYARNERISDITIGDFWNINRKSLNKKTHKKISVVLINTEKGMRFWENAKRNLIYEERKYSEAISGNKQLSMPSSQSEDRKIFLTEVEKNSWIEALKKTELSRIVEKNKNKKYTLKEKIIYSIKRFVKMLTRR